MAAIPYNEMKSLPPASLQKNGFWCVWKLAERDGKKTKVPYNAQFPESLALLRPNDRATYCDYKKAQSTLDRFPARFDGIGIGFFDGLCGIDVDHCVSFDAAGHIQMSALARDLLDRFKTYAELSPSRTGIHIYIKADLNQIAQNKTEYEERYRFKKPMPETAYTEQAIEIYPAGMTSRYFTFTGCTLSLCGGAAEVESRTAELRSVLDTYMAKAPRDSSDDDPWEKTWSIDAPIRADRPTPRAYDDDDLTVRNMSDSELLDRARNAQGTGGKFRALFDHGDTSAFAGDDSAADQALCRLLAYWTRKDAARMNRLFSQSALMREKWKREDYRRSTIGNAISYCRDMYAPTAFRQQQTARDFSDETAAAAPCVRQTVTNTAAPAEPAEVDERTAAEIRADFLADTVEAYQGEFLANISDGINRPAVPTGFRYLDEHLDGGLYPGLYVIGAISSLGKTSLVMQMADQIAETGQDVIIFSLEMSRDEIIAKSISRLTYQRSEMRGLSSNNAKTARGIMDGSKYAGYNPREKELIKESTADYFSSIAPHLRVRLPGDDFTSKRLREYIDAYTAYTKQDAEEKGRQPKAPVIIVDYLQLLAADDPRLDDKRAVDHNIKLLKNISRDYRAPVIVVSSFNRDNYDKPASMSSYKESGGIEYASDVLIGLQLLGTGGKDFDVNAAKQKSPREIEAVILKNRMGKTGLKVYFKYRAMFNVFENVKELWTPAELGAHSHNQSVDKKKQKEASKILGDFSKLSETTKSALKALYHLSPLDSSNAITGVTQTAPAALEAWQNECYNRSTRKAIEGKKVDFERAKYQLLAADWIIEADDKKGFFPNPARCAALVSVLQEETPEPAAEENSQEKQLPLDGE